MMKNRADVIGMILTSFDQEEYEKTIRDESYQEGKKEGKTSLVAAMLKRGMSPEDIKKYSGVSDELLEKAKERLQKG